MNVCNAMETEAGKAATTAEVLATQRFAAVMLSALVALRATAAGAVAAAVAANGLRAMLSQVERTTR